MEEEAAAVTEAKRKEKEEDAAAAPKEAKPLTVQELTELCGVFRVQKLFPKKDMMVPSIFGGRT